MNENDNDDFPETPGAVELQMAHDLLIRLKKMSGHLWSLAADDCDRLYALIGYAYAFVDDEE